jgi:TrmH family RNA methyltransferase
MPITWYKVTRQLGLDPDTLLPIHPITNPLDSMLTSTKNPRIQKIRRLQSSARTRRKESLFVVEGVRLVEEALVAGWQPALVIFTEDITARGRQTVDRFQALGTEALMVAPHVMEAASDTKTPQGILAVLPTAEWELPVQPTFLLIPDRVRDPGNLGTLLRTALAAGVEAVILPPGGVDAFSPKVVRAGMGAHFKLPIIAMDWETIGQRLAGLSFFLADSGGGAAHFEARFESPLALIIGGEASGAGDQARKLATRRVHIPMPGKAESLNAAVAGSILMFEVLRQRS